MIQAKAVIFDLDCTLVDTLRRFFDVFNALLEKHGKGPLSWNAFFQRYVDDTLDAVVAPPDTEDRERMLHGFWLEFLRKYREENPDWELISGAKKILKELHGSGIPIAVITSCITPVSKLEEELDDLGIGEFVKIVVTAQEVVGELEKGHHFSKTEIFKLAVKKLETDPRDIVIVGDYWNDIRDGKRVGAKTVAVLTGLMRRELLEKHGPDAIVESVRDLPKVVEFRKGGE
jgi:phosphoglycolate phosphatase